MHIVCHTSPWPVLNCMPDSAMSLFGNLFRADNGGASQLFSSNNPYLALRSSAADVDADTGVNAALDAAIGQLEQAGAAL